VDIHRLMFHSREGRRMSRLDGRYPHFLAAMADKLGPQRVVCVDPVSDVIPRSENVTTRTEILASWNAVCLDRADGELAESWSAAGRSAATFWDVLQYELAKPGLIWLVSYQCTRAWALLGLWDLLQAGQARIAGGDARAVYDPVVHAARAKPGLLVVEDPPNIAQLRIGASHAQILWIDCRNWGVSCSPGIDRGKAVVGDLASLVVRLDRLGSDGVGLALAPTAAGAAWRSWRSGVGKKGIHCHANQAALDLERAAHIGGRCEAFRLGKLAGKWYHLDFRSAYAAVMKEETLPIRLEHCERLDNDKDIYYRSELCRAVATVSLDTDEPAYPLLKDGLIIYPIGRFTTTLCGPELVDAYEKGRTRDWHETAVYELDLVTPAWVSALYIARCCADHNEDRQVSDYCKAVINSLPGKLGQRFRCWEVKHGALSPEPWGEWHQQDKDGKLTRWRSLAGVVQKEIVGGYGQDAVPAMAAWINSCGRMRLLHAIRVAGWEETAYVDTDSIFVSETGLDRLVNAGMVYEGSLGKLEVRSCPASLEILGVKHYCEDSRIKYAGCPRGVWTESSDGKSRWYTPPAAEGAKRRHAIEATSTKVLMQNPGPYRHGVVEAGGRVRPFRLG
jgi:hypothetical protein